MITKGGDMKTRTVKWVAFYKRGTRVDKFRTGREFWIWFRSEKVIRKGLMTSDFTREKT